MAGFLLGGLGIFGIPLMEDMWRPVAAVSSVVSFALIALFWHRQFVFALLINAGVFVVLLWAHWPPADVIGS